MFLLSNFVLKNMGIVKSTSAIASYSIAIGMVIYAAIYLYILYYHQEKLAFFNTILMYVVSIDLLLSSAVYNKQMLDTKSEEYNDNNTIEHSLMEENDNETEDETECETENVDLLTEENELVASEESTEGSTEESSINEFDEEMDINNTETNQVNMIYSSKFTEDNPTPNTQVQIPSIVVSEMK